MADYKRGCWCSWGQLPPYGQRHAKAIIDKTDFTSGEGKAKSQFIKQETRSKKREARNEKQETRNEKREARNEKQETRKKRENIK